MCGVFFLKSGSEMGLFRFFLNMRPEGERKLSRQIVAMPFLRSLAERTQKRAERTDFP